MLNALRTDNSPFDDDQIALLRESVGRLDQAQSAWLSGYLAGRLAGEGQSPDASPAAGVGETLDILYASQTGNGEAVAEALAGQAQEAGVQTRVRSLESFRPAALKKLKHAAFVISTHGEGDPPDDAIELFEFLQGDRAPRLPGLRFCVLALGDLSYSRFCEAGRQLEARLTALGAKPFAGRIECDVDFGEAAGLWSGQVVEYAQRELGADGAASRPAAARLSVVDAESAWNRARPFPATVERVQRITGRGSTREVCHLELSLEGSGLRYEPGDALGVRAENDPELVSEIAGALELDPGTPVEHGDDARPLREWLAGYRELTRLSGDTVDAWAALGPGGALESRLQAMDGEQRRAFIEARQFADLVEAFPARPGAAELVALLRPLAPRSYSIASSMAAVEDEVHLTVATLSGILGGTPRTGVASGFLNRRLHPGDEVGVFIEPNRRFRLPDDRGAPLILVAAGTGIAPYRAFLQQLEEEGQAPDTWLIFGNPQLRTDFLYQREWLRWRSGGLLGRIDTAWSRDRSEKHYVQHLVREHGDELVRWLDRGARFYLCGGLAMGQAVESALHDAIAAHRGTGETGAAEYLSGLRRERRLLKDLY